MKNAQQIYIYLNESDLASYISAVEGGTQNKRTTQRGGETSKGGSVGAASTSLSMGKNEVSNETTDFVDTPSAQFERFRKWAIANREQSEWVDVLNPNEHLEGISVGEFVEVEGEIFVPEVVRALAKTNGMADALSAFGSLFESSAIRQSAGISDEDADAIGGMKSVLSAFSSDLVLLSELDDSDWKVVGKLEDEFIKGDISGNARVVGKVSDVIKTGEWKHLLNIPGMNLMNREQRRAMQQNGPDDPKDSSWVKGPAIVLDILAVYR